MTDVMQALVKMESSPGHLELQEVPIPDIGADEVLVEIAYCGICGSDLHIEAGTHPAKTPLVIGHEFSGVVAAVGGNVTEFAPGDEVGFRRSWTPFPGVDADGGFAEYMRAPARALWHVPEGITLKAATQFETVRPPMTMVRDRAGLSGGERVVVSGPGPIGLLVTNVAKMDGASSVTVIGTGADSDVRLPMAERMGADETLVFDDSALEEIDDDPPSVWFETSGAAPAVEAAVDHVADRGTIVSSGLGDGPWNVDMRRVAYDSLQILGQWGGEDEYVEAAAEAMQSGELDVAATITDTVPLSQWREGFETARSQSGIKVLLDPSR